MNYTKVDIDEWSRGTLFRFYIEKMRIVMGLTVDINVAPLITYTKKNGLKFYPAMKRALIGNQPQNFFDVSCLPWVKYKHFDVHVFDEGKFLGIKEK